MEFFWGKVRHHNQRGRKLGFPTANINLRKNISEGIYISHAKLGNSIYQALTFIGQAKTFNEKRFHAETYILDFKQNMYGKWISVKLLKKIRNNEKFDCYFDNTNRQLLIFYSGGNPGKIMLYTLSGSLVLEDETSNQQWVHIKITHLKQGIYFLKIPKLGITRKVFIW